MINLIRPTMSLRARACQKGGRESLWTRRKKKSSFLRGGKSVHRKDGILFTLGRKEGRKPKQEEGGTYITLDRRKRGEGKLNPWVFIACKVEFQPPESSNKEEWIKGQGGMEGCASERKASYPTGWITVVVSNKQLLSSSTGNLFVT